MSDAPPAAPRFLPAAVWIVVVSALGAAMFFAFRLTPVSRTSGSNDDVEIAGSGIGAADSGILPATFGPMRDAPLTERSGRSLRTGDLLGRWTAYAFLFTDCAGTCPRLSAELKALQNATSGDREFRIAVFTTKPATDTPAVLAGYADRLGADPERWLFLRAATEDLDAISRQDLKVNHSPTDPLLHSNSVTLCDPQGLVRAKYEPLTDRGWIDSLRRDLESLRR